MHLLVLLQEILHDRLAATEFVSLLSVTIAEFWRFIAKWAEGSVSTPTPVVGAPHPTLTKEIHFYPVHKGFVSVFFFCCCLVAKVY